jgi:hypothetical protein
VNANWPVTSTDIPAPSIPTFVPTTDKVLVGSNNGKLYQMNVVNPLPSTSVTLGDGSAVVGTPTVDLLNSMIYVGTDEGVIYAVQFPLP